MGGKRQANVLSALIQNFDTAEEVIETSANSAGSALKENEKYLDSIQGKIDQFTNAVQAMWSNFLNADVVKGFVSWGTKIIKSLDTVQGKFLAIVKVLAIFMAYKKINPLDWVNSFVNVVNGIKTDGLKNYIVSLFQVSTAQKTVTADTLVSTIAQQQNDIATQQQIVSKMGLTNVTGALTAAQKIQAAQELVTLFNGGLISEDLATRMAAMLGYKFSVDATNGATVALDTTTKAFMASNPVGWILLIVSAVVALVMWISTWDSKTEKLTEKLKDLKSELQDVRSEIDSVNSELETTQDRMAELLSMDSLSFTEKEELDNLKKQNDELQRKLDLLELQEKQMKKETAKTFVETMQSDVDNQGEYYLDSGSIKKVNFWTYLAEGSLGTVFTRASESDYIASQMQDYQIQAERLADIDRQIIEAREREDSEQVKALEKRKQGTVEYMDEIMSYINGKITEFNTNADGLEYGIDPETDKWLDYINNMQDKWAITSGGDNAKTNAITRIFNKDENTVISDSIDGYVEALKKGDKTAEASIENIIKNNAALVADLKASGLSIKDAVGYFTSFASEANYATIDGKIKEIDEATKRLNNALGDINTSSIDSIKQALTDKGWVDTEGNLMSDVIAEHFGGEDGGISEETRAEIERLVKQIYDGKISVEDALKSFELFGVQSVIEIQVEEVKTNFKDVFVELEDADGLINTFEELGDAIGSTVGALEAFNQAQADVADKGFVSIQTALQLMEYTDDYGSVLQVVDGKLQLAANAEQNLIQARIDAIKVSAQTAVADAQAAYDKAELAVQSYRSAMVEDASASTVATAWQKIVAAAAGIKNALDNIWSGESISDLYNAGYNTYLESATGYETAYDDAGLQALVDAQKEAGKTLQEAKDNAEIANALTADSLEDVFNSSDKSTPEEVSDDRFQKEMDYWENRIAANQARYEQLQNEIDLLEAKGQKADASYYEEQIKLENERLWLLEQQRAAALSRLQEIEAAGGEGSEEWWEVANTLNDIEGELDDVTASIVDLQDAIGEIDTYKFEEFNSRLDDITSKLGTIRDLIAPDGEEDWFNDQGEWTEEGVAVLGTYIQELETYKNGLAEVNAERAKYNKSYQGNEDYYASLGIHSEQEYYDKVQELTEQQYDYAQSISDTEQSVVDMYESNIDAVEEYTESLIDSYNDYIDSVKEALDAERDLYDFKKKVKNQTKEIAAIERRIASLSGSTNASDIAERRRLEADLYGAREELDDTYYDHAKTTQQEALDNEAAAYEEAMTRFVDGLRVSLDQATTNMDEFLMGVTSMVMYNADTVLSKYEETNLPLTDELTNPWEEAQKAVSKYSGDALALMNKWTEDGGFFAQFNSTGTTNLKSPWKAGAEAASTFKNNVATAMDNVVSKISTNVKTASGELSKLYQQIKDTEQRAANVTVSTGSGGGSSGGGGGGTPTQEKIEIKKSATAYLKIGNTVYSATGSGSSLSLAKTAAIGNVVQKAYNAYKAMGYDDSWLDKRYSTWKKNVTFTKPPVAVKSNANIRQNLMYAKGTTGTERDEWAITDEPWLGDELVLVPGKDGNLSFMRKGTGVVPADLTANLMEWGQFTPDSMNLGSGINVNMVNNAVNKPEFNLSFEALVKAERIDENTLPEVKKYVQQEINTLVKQMNYAIKGKGGR